MPPLLSLRRQHRARPEMVAVPAVPRSPARQGHAQQQEQLTWSADNAATPPPVNTLACLHWLVDMYEQIAQNKRRAVLYAIVFFVVWLGIGALVGWVAAVATSSSGTSNVVGDVVGGALVARVIALLGIAYAVS